MAVVAVWKMMLRLDSRLILRGAIAIVLPSDNWLTALRKHDILRATEPTEEEQKALDAASTLTMVCDDCGKKTSILSNEVRLDELPDSLREVLLEDAPFKWLEKFEETHTPWPPNLAFRTLHDAIKGAEKVKKDE